MTNVVIAGGTLTGTGTLAAGSQVTWSSGAIAGSITNAGTLTATAGGTETLTGTLTNSGSIVVDSGVTIYQSDPSSGASIINQAGATFDLQGTAYLDNAYINNSVYVGGTFTNVGTLEKSTGTGIATLGYALNNSATVMAATGTLALSGGGTWSGATSVGGTVALAGGTFTLNVGASVAPVPGGSGTLQVTGGALSVTGSDTLTAVVIAGGTLTGTGTLAAGSQVIWSSGAIAGSITNAGTLTATAGGTETLTGTLTNSGSIVVDSGVVIYQGDPSSGASIINQAGATFDLQGTAYLDNAYINNSVYVGGTFTNAGTLEKSTGTGIATMGYALVDSGAIAVDSATLDPTGGVTGTNATITVASGATYLMTGTYTGSFSGSGAGTASLTGITAGSGGVSLNFTGSTLQWTGGTLTGPATNLGTLTAATSGLTLAGTLTNSGSIVVDSGVTIYQGDPSSGASIINQAGATFDLQGTAYLDNAYTNNSIYVGGTFTNAGTLENSTGTGIATLGYALNNSATVTAAAGTLALSAGGTWSGATSVGGTVALTGGTLTLNAGASVAPVPGGSGTLQVTGGALSLTGSDMVTNVVIAGGTLTGTGTLAAGSQVTWTSGAISGSITNAGTLTATAGGTETLTGTLTNSGSIVVDSGVTIYQSDPSSGASIINQAGATFDLQGTAYLDNAYTNNSVYTGGTFTNVGTLEKSTGTGTASLGYALSNTGMVNVESGTLYQSGSFSNFSGTILTGGTYSVSGTGQFEFAGANIVTNAATIVLDGPSSAIIDTSNGNALAGFTTNAAGGQFTVQDGASFTTAVALSNAGGITVSGGSTLTVSGAFGQSGGSTTLAQGTLTSTTSTVTLTGGLLSGTGTVKGNVSNTGAQISPGTTNAAGTLTIQGTYTQGTGGTLDIALGGLGAGVGYDQLAVTGTASLGGTINISTINGYVPTVNTSFQVLTFASKTGNFQTYNGLYIAGQIGLIPAYSPSSNPVNLTLTTSNVVNDWINPAGGDWDTASNWTYGVPVAGQSVAIPYSGITVTHTQATAEPIIASLDDLATLNISSGSIAIGAGSSTFAGPVTVGAAASLSMAAGAHLLVSSTFNDAGAVTFSSGDQVTVYYDWISVSGSLTTNSANFINGGAGAYITFTSTATLTGGSNTFGLPIYVPYTLVPSLAGNTSFDQVYIESGTIASGTLALNLIGSNPSMTYLFDSGFTVAAGGAMTVGMNVPVYVGSTFNDAGAVTFSSGDKVTVYYDWISVSGSLTTNGANFINGGEGAYITFTSTATLTGGSNTFGLPIYVPYTLVPSLAGNTSFDQVYIESGTIASGTLALNLIGSNPSMTYLFDSGFTVAAGGAMTVGMNVPVYVGSTFNDAGAVTFSSGDQVTVYYDWISVSGSLTTNSANFINGGEGAYITFTSTATLTGGSNTFGLPIYVPYTLVPSLAGNTSFDQIYIESGTISSGTLALNLIGNNASMTYLFDSGFTVAAGGAMTVDMNVPVYVGSTFNDAGAVTFSSGDKVTVYYDWISVSGSLTTNGANFINGGEGAYITFSPTATLTGGSNSFGLPIYVPYTLVTSLAGNASFDQIYIESGTISSGTLALNLIGNNASMTYLFDSGFTVAAGGAMTVGMNVPVYVGSTFNDAGAVTFSSGDKVTVYYDWISVSGSLTTNGANFINGGEGAYITFSPTATLTGGSNSFGLPIYVPYMLVTSLAGNASFDQIYIESGTISSGTLALNLIGNNASMTYLFDSGFTVAAGGAMTVGMNVPVYVGSTFNDAGAVTFSSGDKVTVYYDWISVSGSLTTNGANFINGGEGAYITFTSTATLTGGSNTFGLPIYVPYTLVTSLAGNTSFDQIYIESGTISSGTLALNLIGNNASMTYLFDSGFTVAAGGAMVVGTNVPVYVGSTFNDAGAVTFSSGDQVTVYYDWISVSGSLTATGANFINGGEGPYIAVNSGGDLTVSGSKFAVPLTLASGSTDNLQFVTFSTQLAINSGATINVSSDDFTSGTVAASGTASATISLIDNFWGTINPTQIAAKITDHADNASLPYVTYQPFLSEDASATYSSNASVVYNANAQEVALSATVVGAGGPVTGGTETFTILSGSTDVGTPITENVANGAASGTYTIPAGTLGGVYTIQAVFSGTSTLTGSSDSSHTLTISDAATTTAAKSASTTFSTSNQTISLSATVTSLAGIVNEGTETFTILSGMTTIGTPATANVSNGAVTASYTLPGGTAVGTYTIEAVYNGTVDFATSTDTSQSLTINAHPTITWDSADYPTGGAWDNAAHWLGGVVPGSANTAVIDLSSGVVTTGASDSVLNLVTNSSTTISVSNGSLTLGAATSTIDGSITVSGSGSLNLNGTTLNGTGTVTDSGHLTTSNSSTGLSSITMASGSALNLGNFTVQPGATLSVSASASVTMGPPSGGNTYTTLTDNGTLSFASGDTVGLSSAYISNPGIYFGAQIVVGNGGLLQATGTAFNAPGSAGVSYTNITVNSGGHLQATSSTFAVGDVYLADGVVFNAGDLTGDGFDSPLYIPAIDVQYLASNLRFQSIYVQPDTIISGETLALNSIGTQTTTNLRYVFPGGLTVNQGGIVTAAASIPVVLSGGLTVNQGGSVSFGPSDAVTMGPPSGGNTYTTLTDNGTLSFASGDTMGLSSSYISNPGIYFGAQIVVGNGGLLQATGTAFNAPGSAGVSFTNITVNSGGHLQATSSSFAIGDVFLADGVVFNAGDLTGDGFDSPLYIPAIDVQYLASNLRFQSIYVQPDTIISGETLALNSIGTQTTTNLRYVFPGGLTVNQGGIVTAAASIPVVLSGGLTVNQGGSVSFGPSDAVTMGPPSGGNTYTTLTDNGTLSFASGDTMGLSSSYISNPGIYFGAQIVVGNGGLLQATGTAFNAPGSAGVSYTNITVNSGGRLQATSSTFAVGDVYLADGVVFNAGDLTGDGFDSPLYIPAIDVQYLASNLRFQSIYVQPDTIISGETLALNSIGTQTTTNLRYVFPGGLTVNQGGIVTAAASIPVVLSGGLTVNQGGSVSFGPSDAVTMGPPSGGNTYTTLTDNGTLSFASGDTMGLSSAYISNPGIYFGAQIVVGNGGLLQATGTAFNAPGSAGVSFTNITVNSGGHLQATSSSFAIGDVFLADGVVFNAGDLTGDGFDSPLYIPAIDVQYLASNLRFQSIYVQPDTIISGETLALNSIGTQTTTNLRYVFPGGLTVNQGGIVTAAASIPVVLSGGLTVNQGGSVSFGPSDAVTMGPPSGGNTYTTLTDNGTLSFASGDTMGLSSSYISNPGIYFGAQIVVGNGGLLQATGTAFNAPGSAGVSFTNITVNSGGHFIASQGSLSVGNVYLNSGSTDTIQFSSFATQLAINSGATINVSSDDFTNGTVAASGTASATISLIDNFWGTINPTQIAAKITDHADNANLPYVTYQPFLSEDATGTNSSNALLIYSANAQTVTLSATVISAEGPVTGGTETFTILSGLTDVGTPITENVANGATSGTYTIPAGTLGGVYTIQAVFSGTSTLLGSSDSSHTLTIGGAATTTAASSATTTYGASNQTISLSATVTSAAGIVNEGTETFSILSGTTPVGSPATANVVNGAVTASYTLPGGTIVGTYTIQAVYNGTVDFTTSTDTSQLLTINAPITTVWNTATAPTGGDWDTPGNWVGGVLPTASSNVIINLTSSGTVTHSTGANDDALSLTTNGKTALSIGSGSIALGHGSSTFGGPVLISPGATLSVGASASVVLTDGQTITDNGTLKVDTGATVLIGNGATISVDTGATMTVAAASVVYQDTNNNVAGGISVSGTLAATSTSFTSGGGGVTASLVVNSGGHLTATGSNFAWQVFTLAAGSVLNQGDLTGDSFNMYISVPITDIPLLAGNVVFESIYITSANLPSGTIELTPNLPSSPSPLLQYVFPSSFEIKSGATLKVDTGATVLIGNGATISVDTGATMTVAAASVVYQDTNNNVAGGISVSGTLAATSTSFTSGGGGVTASLVVNSGGHLTATGSNFAWQVFTLAAGSVLNQGDLTGDSFNMYISVPISDIPLLAGNVVFESIYITSANLPSGTIELTPNLPSSPSPLLQYVFPSSFEIKSGATLKVDTGATVLIGNGATISVDAGATMTVAAASVVYQDTNNNVAGGISVSGTLAATSTSFTSGGGGVTASLVVNSGGHLTATGSNFAWQVFTLAAGSVLNQGDLTGDSFNMYISVPISDIPLLAGNVVFESIYITSANLPSGTIELTPNLPSSPSPLLQYVFPSSFEIKSGATLKVDTGATVLIGNGATISVDAGATMTVATASVVYQDTNNNVAGGISVSGTLAATSTSFTSGGGGVTASLVVNSGGHLTATGSNFAWQVFTLAAGSVLNQGDLTGDSFNMYISVPITDIPLLAGNVVFETIYITSANLPSGTIELTPNLPSSPSPLLQYVFPSSFEIKSGATLKVDTGATVLIGNGATISVDTGATMTVAAASVVYQDTNNNVAGGISVSGTLAATSTSFTSGGGGVTASLVVNSGGHLTATGSNFAWQVFTLAAGSVLNQGDLTGDSFNMYISVPITDIPLLAGNVVFESIYITSANLPSGTIELTPNLPSSPSPLLQYVFPSSFEIKSGATLKVDTGATVLIGNGATISVDTGATMTVAAASVVYQDTNNNVAGGISVSGTLAATSTSFTSGGGGVTASLVVNSGGHLTATGSNFAWQVFTLAAGSVLNQGDLTGDSFNMYISVPISDIPLLAGNVVFESIYITSANLPSGTIELTPNLPSSPSPLLQYVFPSSFEIKSGATLKVDTGATVLIGNGATISVDAGATMTVAAASVVYQDTNNNVAGGISVSGTLAATGTSFTSGGGGVTASLVVNSGGQLQASNSALDLNKVTLLSGSTGTIQFSSFATQLAINSGATINIHNDDFSSSSATVVASGTSNATIDLTNNFWGSLSTSQIAAKITDHAKNSSLPTVLYEPVISENATGVTAANATAPFSTAAQSVALSATVISAAGLVNTGTVTFTILNGSAVVGTAVVSNVANGLASASMHCRPRWPVALTQFRLFLAEPRAFWAPPTSATRSPSALFRRTRRPRARRPPSVRVISPSLSARRSPARSAF